MSSTSWFSASYTTLAHFGQVLTAATYADLKKFRTLQRESNRQQREIRPHHSDTKGTTLIFLSNQICTVRMLYWLSNASTIAHLPTYCLKTRGEVSGRHKLLEKSQNWTFRYTYRSVLQEKEHSITKLLL